MISNPLINLSNLETQIQTLQNKYVFTEASVSLVNSNIGIINSSTRIYQYNDVIYAFVSVQFSNSVTTNSWIDILNFTGLDNARLMYFKMLHIGNGIIDASIQLNKISAYLSSSSPGLTYGGFVSVPIT